MKLENSEKSYNECEYSLNDDFFHFKYAFTCVWLVTFSTWIEFITCMSIGF